MPKKNNPVLKSIYQEYKRNTVDARSVSVDFARENPQVSAILSKLNQDQRRPARFNRHGDKVVSRAGVSVFKDISNGISDRIHDNEVTMQMFPEYTKCVDTLVACITSPKDMEQTVLNYSSENDVIPPEVNALLLKEVTDYFTFNYNLCKEIPDILEKIFVKSGSAPYVVIPENALDDLINNGGNNLTLESLVKANFINADMNAFRHMGFLEDPYTPINTKPSTLRSAFEKYRVDNVHNAKTYDPTLSKRDKDGKAVPFPEAMLHINDDFRIIQLPKVFEKIKEEAMNARLKKTLAHGAGASFESVNGTSSEYGIHSAFFKNRKREIREAVRIREESDLKRKTIGSPLILKLPSESVMNVFVPGDESRPVGHFIYLDMEGNPISSRSSKTQYDSLRAQSMVSSSFAANLQSASSDVTKDKNGKIPDAALIRTYSDIVSADALTRIRNSVLGSGVILGKNEDLYRTMFYLAMAGQMTQLVFVPAKLMTYFAFDYDNYGIGKSLLDDIKIINTMRSVIQFADMMTSIKNAISRTKINFKFPENDPDPEATMDMAINEFMRTRQQPFPQNADLSGQVDYIQRLALEIEWENHPALPDLDIEITEGNTNHQKIDTDFTDSLRDKGIAGFGVSSTMIDEQGDVDFAAIVDTNNVLWWKRVRRYQDALSIMLSKFTTSILSCDGDFMHTLTDIVTQNLDKFQARDNKLTDADKATLKNDGNDPAYVAKCIEEFFSSFRVSLPQPDLSTTTNQSEAFKAYMEFLEEVIDKAIINGDMFSEELAGTTAQHVTEYKASLIAALARDYLTANNMLPELFKITSPANTSESVFNLQEVQANHIKTMVASYVKLKSLTTPITTAADTDLANLGGTGADGDTADTSDASDTAGGEDDFGMDDVDLDEPDGQDDTTNGSDDKAPAEDGDDGLV